MSSFLASRGVLLTAWGAVFFLLAGGLTLAFVQPPPSPTADPVTVSVSLGPQDDGETVPSSPQEVPPPDSEPASAEKTDAATPPDEPPPPATSETVTVGIAAPGKAGEAQTGQAAPEEEAAEPAADAAPAEVTAALPESAPAAQAETPASQPADVAAPPGQQATTVTPPSPQPAAGETTSSVELPVAKEGGEQQEVAIPLVPPSPEELAYWERYRQPFNMQDPRPRIAVVMTGLGLSDSATEAAINKLPSAITLSFSPYARDLERWIALARARGHEVMMDLPMEPATFPNEDPGPQGLLTSLTAEDNLNRLDWVLSRGSAYVGLAGSMGSRFTASRQAMDPILRDVKERGLIFLDRRTTEHSVVKQLAGEIGLPAAVNNRSVDERQASRVAIDARLAQIERIALTDGFAVAMAQPYPVTLDRLADWATELTARGFVIAPISALADQQRLP